MSETALEQADRNFEVIDGRREKWKTLEPHDPIGVPRIFQEADEWTKTWRDRIPDEWKLPDD